MLQDPEQKHNMSGIMVQEIFGIKYLKYSVSCQLSQLVLQSIGFKPK